MKMNLDEERKKIADFIKAGLLGLSIVLLVFCGVYYTPDVVETFQEIRGERKTAICCVDTKTKEVAISFDCDYTAEYTRTILAVLEKHHVKSTFFMTGSWVTENPEEVKVIAAAGHDLGNHSESHERMSKMSNQQCSEEIMAVHKKVQELTGQAMILFRAPYGDYNNTVIESVNDCGYYCIQWNIDSCDWKDYEPGEIVKQVMENKKLGKGSIILFHNGAKYTSQALDQLLTDLEKKHYQVVPVSKMIYKESFYVNANGEQVSEQK